MLKKEGFGVVVQIMNKMGISIIKNSSLDILPLNVWKGKSINDFSVRINSKDKEIIKHVYTFKRTNSVVYYYSCRVGRARKEETWKVIKIVFNDANATKNTFLKTLMTALLFSKVVQSYLQIRHWVLCSILCAIYKSRFSAKKL